MQQTSRPLIRIHRSEKGSSDGGILLVLLGLAILVSAGLGIMGWIERVKEARTMHAVIPEKVATSPYHEPGAFQVTF